MTGADPSTSLKLAVLGDSIAYGQGAARPTDSIGSRLASALTAAGTPIILRVFAVPGARSDGLAAQTRSVLAWGPQVALIVIGANDLTRFVPPEQAAGQLAHAVKQLVAAGAQVVVAPAPDLSVVPWVPVRMRAAVQGASAALRAAQQRAALAAGALVADVNGATAAAFAADVTLFSADRFHPSSAGYAVIADALKPAVRAAVERVRPGL